MQLSMHFLAGEYRSQDVLENVRALLVMHKDGKLGGERMPEDARPERIEPSSPDNFHFLTLPMALNYQRNSYSLWESAAKAYLDEGTKPVFDPIAVSTMSESVLRERLCKHKVALQPNKHIQTWRRIADAIAYKFDGDLRRLFFECDSDVVELRETVQKREKNCFPYLSGPKIFNYWLYVIEHYTPLRLTNRSEITVAPDTHIIQSSLKLGLLLGDFEKLAQNRSLVSAEWKRVLEGTEIAPIDVHTPLWLWSRKGFPRIERKSTHVSNFV